MEGHMKQRSIGVFGKDAQRFAHQFTLAGAVTASRREFRDILGSDTTSEVVLVLGADYTQAAQIAMSLRENCYAGVLLAILETEPTSREIIELYDCGFDGFEVAPVPNNEFYRVLQARVKAMQRIWQGRAPNMLQAGNVSYHVAEARIFVGDKSVHLGPNERNLLRTLLQKEGKVYSRDELMNEVWGRDRNLDSRTIDVHIGRLRRVLMKAGVAGFQIETVRSAGYRATW